MRVTRRVLIEAKLNDVEQCVCESPANPTLRPWEPLAQLYEG